jgi:hypothetical protein
VQTRRGTPRICVRGSSLHSRCTGPMPAIQRASKGTKVPDAEDAPTSGAGRAVRAAMGDDREGELQSTGDLSLAASARFGRTQAHDNGVRCAVQVADIPRFLPAVFKDLRADLRFFGVSAVMLASSLFLFYCLVTGKPPGFIARSLPILMTSCHQLFGPGWTPMHHCVQHDMQTALRLLLAMGISPNVEYPPVRCPRLAMRRCAFCSCCGEVAGPLC